MKKVVLVISLAMVFNSCNGQSKDVLKKEGKDNNQMIDILRKQIEYGRPGYENPYEYTNQDLEIIIPEAKNILKSYGFKFLKNDEFNDRIKTIFNRIIDIKSASKFLSVDFHNQCNKIPNYYPSIFLDFDNLFVIKNENFITENYAIPQIIDYQKKFPNLAESENTLPKTYTFEDGEQVLRYLWKDVQNLVQQRQHNIDVLVNRNKYLFNDSKASLVWLKFHDEYFLESLVKTFGYVQDKDLLKWVLDRNLNNDEFDKLLFTKTCDNKYFFHKEIFEVMNEADIKKRKEYIAFLKGHFPKTETKNYSDDMRIQALYCYHATKLVISVDETDIDVFAFFPRLNQEESEQEFIKNNYYSLPDFKTLFNNTRYRVPPIE